MIHRQDGFEFGPACKVNADKAETSVAEGHIGIVHQFRPEIPEGMIVGSVLAAGKIAAALAEAFAEPNPHRCVTGPESQQPDATAHFLAEIQDHIAALFKNGGTGFGKADLQRLFDQ